MAKRDIDEVDSSASDTTGFPSPKRTRFQPPVPWHQNNYWMKKLTLEELAAEGILDIAGAHLGDLSNTIHPLFCNFLEDTYLYPALRIASLFLTQAECLPFFLALISQPYHRLPELEKDLQGPCYRFSLGPQPPSPDSLEKLRMLLQIATPMININFSDKCPKNCWAVCYRRTEPHPFPYFKGSSSTIHVNPLFGSSLDPLRNPDASISQQLRVSYYLANTLVHEIAHALRNARVPPPPPDTMFDPPRNTQDYEPFFEDQRRAEVGHAWESVVEGGRLLLFPEEQRPGAYGLYTEKWPDIDDFFMQLPLDESPLIRFQDTGLIVPPRTHIVPVRRRQPQKWTTVYGVPMTFVQQLFTRRFWEERVPKEGLQALRFNKRLGVRTRNYEWEQGEDVGVKSDDSSWGRWPDFDGVIRIGQSRIFTPMVEEFGEDVGWLDNASDGHMEVDGEDEDEVKALYGHMMEVDDEIVISPVDEQSRQPE
ncbi:hypothetical protein MMC08_008522 [Hypocenomyce scalaris]|nr:hypothetical protein [Hypocenomyce scalaris]